MAVLIAAAIGAARADSQWRSQPFPADYAFGCPPLPAVKTVAKKIVVNKKTVVTKTPVTESAAVAETLTIDTKSQFVSYTITEVVTVPVDNRSAQALMLDPGSAAAKQAAACLFTLSVNGVPELTSAANGRATFRVSYNPPFPSGEWTSAAHLGGIRLGFDPSVVCGSGVLGDWAGTTLTLTVKSDTPLTDVKPVPDSIARTTYVWRSPAQACGSLTHVSVRVPTGLAGYLEGVVNGPGIVGESTALQTLGWVDPLLTGLIALWLTLRMPRTARKRSAALALVVVALLGIGPAAFDLSLSQDALRGAAELIACYGAALGVLIVLWAVLRPGEAGIIHGAGSAVRRCLGLQLSRRARLAASGAAGACAAAGLLVCAYRYPVWFPGASVLLTVAAAVLLVAVGVVSYGVARAVTVPDEPKFPAPAWASVGKARDLMVTWAGAAALVAVAYSAGRWIQFGSVQTVMLSEYQVFRYPLAAFAQVLVPVALMLPLAATGRPAGKIAAAAAFGFAMAANQPDVLVGGGWGLPLGTAAMSILAYAVVRKDDEEPHAPRTASVADATLAVKIAALLATIPVGYFIYTTVASLFSTLSNPVFVVSSVLGQMTGWLVIGVFYGSLSSRLPGRIGPVKALILAGAWFTVAITVQIVNNALHFPADRAWIFAGLQFTLFLIVFSVIWDAFTLKQPTVPETVNRLREEYHLQQAQTVALYAIPVLLAVVALVQQVASGSGSDFVTSILNGAAAAFGGR